MAIKQLITAKIKNVGFYLLPVPRIEAFALPNVVERATSILTQRIDEVSLEMKEQQSEDVAASVSEENKDAKDMKQSASSNDNEQTEVEEEKVARSAFRR